MNLALKLINMKKLAFIAIIITISFVSMSFINKADSLIKSSDKVLMKSIKVSTSEEVKGIIENKCYGCHNSESKNTKGKKKLSFDKLDELSIYKQIGKYEGIHEAITEGEMPPEKFLAKYPNKALTDQEKKTLIDWAATKGKELAK